MAITMSIETEGGSATVTYNDEIQNMQDLIECVIEPLLLGAGYGADAVHDALYDDDEEEGELVYHPACEVCMGLMEGNC